MRTTRWFSGLAAAAALAMGGTASAQLALAEPAVSVVYSGPGVSSTTVDSDWLVDATPSDAFMRADLAGGRFRAAARWPMVSAAQVQSANARSQFVIRNDGLSPVALAAGALRLRVDARLTQSPGGTAAGSSQNRLLVSLSGGGRLAQVLYLYSVNASGDLLDIVPAGTGGATATVSVGRPDRLTATLAFPALTLAPGDTLPVAVALEASAFGNTAWGATSNAAQPGATLSLTLPAGVTLAADRPLAWVRNAP